MADDATTPAPGTHPDAAVINDNGSVTTRKGKGFVWVHDETTGARYDVPARMLPRAGIRPVEGYPVNYQPQARAPKTALQLGDLPPTAGRASSAPAVEVGPELAAARAAEAAVTGSTEPPHEMPVDAGDPTAETPTGDTAGDDSASTTSPKSTTNKAGTAGGKAGAR